MQNILTKQEPEAAYNTGLQELQNTATVINCHL